MTTMSGGLALMARRHELETFGYLLEMAWLEAENINCGVSPTNGDH